MTDVNDTTDQTPNIRNLREAADRGRAAETENQQLRRELMFARAGIDTESKLGSMLFKTWEGDDVTALKAEAIEIGALRDPANQPAVEQNNDDVEGQQEFRRTLSQGGAPGTVEEPTADPRDEALAQYHRDVKSGVPPEKAQLAAFDRIWTAAVSKDERVLVGDNWRDNFRA